MIPRPAWAAAAGIALALSGSAVAASGELETAGDVGVFFLLMTLLIVAASVVAALIATRQPADPIGWILCGFSLFMGAAVLATGYAQVAPDDATDGLGQVAAWISNWSFAALSALTVFVLLLFPDGRLLSPRWRAAWCGGVASALLAVSTLVVAALSLPVRRHVQGFVDRRFYRRRYDASRTPELSTVRLRRELDFDTLSRDLRAVVDDTVRPAHVPLWLRSVPR